MHCAAQCCAAQFWYVSRRARLRRIGGRQSTATGTVTRAQPLALRACGARLRGGTSRRNPRLETLCRISNVSERTLTTAFREVTGLTPLQFIKARRLDAAQSALVRARRTDISIKSVALDLGFWHLGYFARDYRAQFAESPSQTLARR